MSDLASKRPQFRLADLLEQHRRYLTTSTVKMYGQLTHDANTVNDLVQQTYFEALRSASKFQFSTDAEFRSWLRTLLFRQARRLCGREIARLRCEAAYARGRSTQVLDSPLDEMLVVEFDARIVHCLSKLSTEDRQAIRSRLDGVNLHDWAARLGITAVAAKKRRTRAIQRLKEVWNDCEKT